MNITIVGGGFGGVKTALELSKNKSNIITLISDKSYFQYYPALYGTATGRSHLQSWVPLGTIFAGHDNINVKIDTITKINKAEKTLTAKSGNIYTYKKLVIAIGVVTTYFGIKGLDTYAYGIKSYDEIMKLKKHIYREFSSPDTSTKNLVIVGAGATGVELSSALVSYLKRLQKRHGIKNRRVKISLIEAAPKVLPRMSIKASKKVAKRLKKLGVKVLVGKTVEEATVDEIIINDKPIKSHTIIWTSGVTNHPFFKDNESEFELAKNGKVIVDDYLQSGKDVYVIGDNAFTPYSGLAQTAMHDAIFVAKHLKSKNPKAYKAKSPPIVVPVGEKWAVLEWKGVVLSGWIASVIRSCADFIGYRDILPIGQSLSVWHAQSIMEDDYFAEEYQG